MTPPKLFVYLKSDVGPFSIPDDLLSRIRGDHPDYHVESLASLPELEARITEPRVVVTWAFKPEWYARAPQLAIVCTPAAGRDWAPPDPSGRVDNHYGSFHGHMIGESLLGMVLYFNRRFDIMRANQFSKTWERSVTAGSSLLRNQRVLFLGYGAIGRLCATVMKPFGVAMAGLQRAHAAGVDPVTGVEYVRMENLSGALSAADHIAAMLPGDSSTDQMFRREHFAAMRRGAFFYNVGRGNCYDEDDLVWALQEGILAGAGLDVFGEEPLPPTSELWEMGNVLITPHASCIYRDYLYLYYEELKEILKGT